jgi:hypothetical protein
MNTKYLGSYMNFSPKAFCAAFILSLVSIQALLAGSNAILVDFGSSGMQSKSSSANALLWNNIHDVNLAKTNSNLITTQGASSGVSLSITGYNGVNINGTTVSDTSVLGSLSVSSATSDSFYVATGSVLSIKLGNLPADGSFRITLFGSRDVAEERSSLYKVTGLETVQSSHVASGSNIGLSPQLYANRNKVSRFENVRPRTDGSVVIDVRASTGAYAYLNALSIEMTNGASFLEPTGQVFVYGATENNSILWAKREALNTTSDGIYFWESVSFPGEQSVTINQSAVGASSYIVGEADIGRYIRCRISPSNIAQTLFPSSVSNWYGPIRPSSYIACYHVGNSLTRLNNIPAQLLYLSANEPAPTFSGYQLADGRNIKFHWENGLLGGADLSLGSRAREEILTNSWNALILQPHSQEWQTASGIADLQEYSRRFYQLADARGMQVYLYLTWPWQTLSLSAQSQINSVTEQVRTNISINGSKPALIIPAGQALRAVIEACGSGALIGYSRSSFYADHVHQTALGGYVTALTQYATIYKKSPVGLPTSTLSPLADNTVVAIPVAVATRIQEIVWDVVRTYPNSGLIDSSEPPPPLPPVVIPPVVIPPVVEVDPPFLTESITPSDPELLAFAFGTGLMPTPIIQEHLPKAVASTDPSLFTVQYTVNSNAESNGVIYTPNWSYNLKNWTLTQPADTTITRAGNTVRISWPKSSRWRFLRIHLLNQ